MKKKSKAELWIAFAAIALIYIAVAVLERMCPHHFETGDQGLVVLPVHVWSSVPSAEHNHPMFNGTFTM